MYRPLLLEGSWDHTTFPLEELQRVVLANSYESASYDYEYPIIK